MSNPNDPNLEQQPQVPAAPEAVTPPAPQYAPPAPPAPPAPQYAAPQQYAAPAAAATSTNVLSIIALISAFVLPFVVPVVLGHISLSQIKRTGEGGRGLALAAVIIGYVEIAAWVLFFIFLIAVIGFAAATSTYSS